MDDVELDVDLDEQADDVAEMKSAVSAEDTTAAAAAATIELSTVNVNGGRSGRKRADIGVGADNQPTSHREALPNGTAMIDQHRNQPTSYPASTSSNSRFDEDARQLSGSVGGSGGSVDGMVVPSWIARGSFIMVVSVYVLLIVILSLLAGLWYKQNELAESLSSLPPTLSPASPVTNTTTDLFPAGSAMAGYQLQSVQLPTNWGASFFAKLSGSGTRLVTVAVLGDSISSGSCSSNQYPSTAGKGYVNVLMQAYQSQYGDGGSGFVSPIANRRDLGNSAYSNDALPVIVSGFILSIGEKGSTDSTFYSSGAVNSTIDSYIRGTVATVVYFVGPSSVADYGTFAVAIDGLWVANIDTLSEGEARQVSTSFAVSAGEHRLLVTVVSGTVWMVGAGGRNSGGVVVDNMSVPGLRIVDIAGGTAYGNPFINSDGGSPVTADMLIIMLGLNDNQPLAVYLAAMRTAITTYQAAGVVDIVIVMSNGGSRAGGVFATYRAELPSLASELHVAFVDLNNIATPSYQQLSEAGFWARTPTQAADECSAPLGLPSTSLADASSVHPSDVGHWNMAHVLWPIIRAPLDSASINVTIMWTPERPT